VVQSTQIGAVNSWLRNQPAELVWEVVTERRVLWDGADGHPTGPTPAARRTAKQGIPWARPGARPRSAGHSWPPVGQQGQPRLFCDLAPGHSARAVLG
jgi:hypothetical protein